MNNLPIRLRAIREQLNFTTQLFSMELNFKGYEITKDKIELYESGDVEPPISYLTALIEYFDVSPYFILGKGEIMFPPRKEMVFIPFFEQEELTKENFEKAHENPTRFVAFPKQFFEEIMSDRESI